MPNQHRFMTITNEDIYLEIKELSKCLGSMKGRIKLNTWIASTALSMCIGCLIGLITSR